MKRVYSVLLLLLIFYSCAVVKSSDKNALDKILAKESNWRKSIHDEVTLYCPGDSQAAEELTKNTNRALAGLQKARDFLQEEYTKPIHIVLVDNNKAIFEMIKRQTNGTAFPKSDAVLEISGVASTCHEKFHLVSINTWGMPKHWISEGMAVYCDNEWWGYDLHQLANYLLRNEKLVPLEKLIQSNKTFHQIHAGLSYPYAGSIVKFIEEVYGRERMLELWRTNDFVKSLGKPVQDIEKEWQRHIGENSLEGISYLKNIGL